jgi:type II secretory pathway pseudopilin PulG
VELLVVIGIIALLVAILLPVMQKVRRMAYRTACASNMRQVGMAFLGYAHDYRGSFPLSATVNCPYREDWIHWQSDRDVKQSALWQYLGKSDRVLKCPSGTMRPAGEYPYSYAVNVYLTGESDPNPRLRRWPENYCRLQQVVNPSAKVMLVEPIPETIRDGKWDGSGTLTPEGQVEGLPSVRHYCDNEYLQTASKGTPIGWTNTIAVDGHHMWIQRWKVRKAYHGLPRYDGPPQPPPPGAD